jgi:hypothetical protein
LTLACVFGCAGWTLTSEEAAFFRDVRPWGFILFGRNVEHPDQVRALTDALRTAARARSALSRVPGTSEPLDLAAAVARFEAGLAGGLAA